MADQNVVSVVALEIMPGKESDFLALTGQMQNLVRRKGYGTNQLLRDGEHPRRYYDIRIWRNAEAAARAESDREIDELRGSLARHLESTPLVDVAWAVEIGLSAAGPWQERRTIGDRRAAAERRAEETSFNGQNRRQNNHRRLGPRRAAEPLDGLAESTLVTAARIARDRAHASFSHFKVGAAIETADGTIVTGCNIENSTYGLTMCAERMAMFKAVSEGHRSFRRMVVVADTAQPTTPCGACRQILWELGGNLEIILADLAGIKSRHLLKDLLPHPFDARFIE
ncbi:MAG TPA: cytidine deaminase [Vicinamibacterales bacterium]|nr:cytidine deaminase [Vicinamibacterales bacterium]